jgi:ketosteroid isomerase-like protein
MDSKEIAIVRDFIAAINQGNASQLSSLMTEDHTFVDSGGKAESGCDNMTKGWEEYFRMFPDYRMEVQSILQDGDLVAAFGSASGTYNGKRGLVPENKIGMPAAWKAIVENGKIKLWQVYADWTEGCKIIDEDNKQSKHMLQVDRPTVALF